MRPRTRRPKPNRAVPPLRDAYRKLYKQRLWSDYAERLCDEAIDWTLEADLLAVLAHVSPLKSLHVHPQQMPRLGLLLALGDPETDSLALEHHHQRLLEMGDLAGAAAALSVSFLHHIETGQFEAIGAWDELVAALLELEELPPLAESCLCSVRGFAELLGPGMTARYRPMFARGLDAAERADSPSLRLYCTVGLAYADLFHGDFGAIEARMLDAMALCEHPDTPRLPAAQLHSFRAMERVYAGAPQQAVEILRKLQFEPDTHRLPEAVKLLVACHQLLATASSATAVEITEIVRALSAQTLPPQRHFFHAYVHLNVGVAALLTQRPGVALSHLDEAVQRGEQAGSAHVVRLAAYVRGQALSDLERADDALRQWDDWYDRWVDSGYMLFAAGADVERAGLLQARGDRVAARRALGRARSVLPEGSDPRVPFRPPDTFERVEQKVIPISPSPWLSPAAPIRIRAYGVLRMEVDGHDVPLRGNRSRTLLAAILAMGGTEIGSRELCDRLWPDADGDRAEGNLKVAVHRLRRLAGATLDEPYPWLTVLDRRVSLNPALCSADSLAFRDAAADALRRDDPEAMVSAMALHGPQEFVTRGDEAWIADHRRELLDDYARLAIALGDALLEERADDACVLPLLHAAQRVPTREALQVLAIRLHLLRGYPSEAMEVYRRTERALRDDLGVEPGKALRACLVQIQRGPARR